MMTSGAVHGGDVAGTAAAAPDRAGFTTETRAPSLSIFTPGQLTPAQAQTVDTSRTVGAHSSDASNTVSWNPTLVVVRQQPYGRPKCVG